MVDIVFSSLLIGLLTGVQPVSVEIAPAAPAAAVIFTLDGKRVARDLAPPWSANVDFGSTLRPHELVATALDATGREVGRARRWVNVPQPAARLEILVERNGLGTPVSARMIATSVLKEQPARRTVTLDSAPLTLDAQGRAALPSLDLTKAHVLSGLAEFSADAVARADVAFGGGVADEAGSRLTAVPIRITGREIPTLGTLKGVLHGPTGPLPPIALEKGSATLLFVRNPNSNEAARRLGRPNRDYPLALDSADRVGFIWPLTRRVSGGSDQTDLFESMGPFSAHDGGFVWLLARLSRPGIPPEPPYRFADAVAVAGMQASGSGTRRAVILVEGDEREDASQLSPDQVTPYLESLGVPLRVWSLLGVGSGEWKGGRPEDISTFFGLKLAVSRLKQDLESQRIVWVPGEWIPGQITLSPDVRSIALLR